MPLGGGWEPEEDGAAGSRAQRLVGRVGSVGVGVGDALARRAWVQNLRLRQKQAASGRDVVSYHQHPQSAC
jgi:hypothetical protein